MSNRQQINFRLPKEIIERAKKVAELSSPKSDMTKVIEQCLIESLPKLEANLPGAKYGILGNCRDHL
jgi:hypothetical protein